MSSPDHTAAALPKINRPPSAWVDQAAVPATAPAHKDSENVKAAANPSPKKRWDPRFALGIIFMVIAVNVTLALLLGNQRAGRPHIPERAATQLPSGPAPLLAPSAGGGAAVLPPQLPPAASPHTPEGERERLLHIITQ